VTLIQLGTLVLLKLALVGAPISGGTLWYAQGSESTQKATDGATRDGADIEMKRARLYLGRRDYAAAANRLKIVVNQFPAASDTEEALARLAEAYLALGWHSQAQTAVAILDRKFPNGLWSVKARSELTSAGLEPAEDPNSWMAKAFK
jgi:outer membrane protein assembly factor BamD